jgi:hypothetical protein
MPITFTTGLSPTFPADSFGSAKEHLKQLATALTAGTAFVNPLDTTVTALVARIDVVLGLLATDISTATADATAFGAWAGDSFLPTSWNDAYTDGLSQYDGNNGIALASTVSGYVTTCTTLQTKLTTLKNYLTVADLNNFKLHMELLSGVDPSPPSGIIKPNLNGLMGLAMSITDTENRFGITFTNYLTGLFGTLFTGDVTIAAAQTHMDTNPFSGGTYASLNVSTNVSKAYVSGATGDALPWENSIVSAKLATITPSITAYDTPISTHQAAFTTHITTDMAYYNTLIAKGKAYVQAYQVSGHIQDPYYRFMYTNVFGHDDIQQTITDLAAGTIT